MDAAQFHKSYDSFPDPLFLLTAEEQWLANPAASALPLTPADFDRLSTWEGNASLFLAGRFYYVHGRRTADGLFLTLYADAFLSSAAMNLSSQLRRRLTTAFSGMDSLKRHLDDGSSGKDDIASVDRALYQIFRLVTELDRCTEDELPCHKTCLDLSEWFRRLGDELRHWCSCVPEVTLHIDLPDSPAVTVADPYLLDYMVAHLVSNALKAAPDGPTDIFISLKKQGEQAVLTIRGSGKAFSPVFFTDPLWNQPGRLLVDRGLGLGLPLSQRIAALHDGTLMVSPTKDGSQVTLSLPLHVPDGFLASPAPRVEPTGGFSMVRIVLSDALPPAAFHPDFPSEWS